MTMLVETALEKAHAILSSECSPHRPDGLARRLSARVGAR